MGKHRFLPDAMRISAKHLYLVIVLLLSAGQQDGRGQNTLAFFASQPKTQSKPDRQLRIYKTALFEGKTEEIRSDAAAEMLVSEEPAARKILLDALNQSDNDGARSAVCRALSQTRTAQEAIGEKDDFIQPLLGILAGEQDFAKAKLAAEALLIFEYGQISNGLEELVTNASAPIRARVNAIYALKLQPDMRAIFQLIGLLDDERIAADAEEALKSLGIPVGKDAKARKQIVEELKRKGKDGFLRDWVIRQESQMRELEAELDVWQGLYIDALNRIYGSIGEDTVKGEFLARHLADSEDAVRLWALEKVTEWRKGTNPKLPVQLGPILTKLVGDQNRDVRLKTARLLSLMGQLNSARPLLEQLEVEQDDEIKMELFVALGGACHYAFSPNSEVTVADEIRKKTLQWAERYLFEQDAHKSENGAKVMKKLLEQNGLAPGDVRKYLGLLAQRFGQEKNKADGVLYGELLNAMGGLCAQNSVCRAEAAKLFEPLFEEALTNKADSVRGAVVRGLINIDKAKALKRLRGDFVNESNIEIKERVINLAGEVGNESDLQWLGGRIASTGEGELAWQAMLKIFKRSDATVLDNWASEFDSQGLAAALSYEQMLVFLEIAERKAVSENRMEVVKRIREKLARIYCENGQFERAAEYLGTLRELARSPEEKGRILALLLDVYLRWPNLKLAVQLVNNCLLEKDLEPNSPIVRSIDSYFAGRSGGSDPNSVLEALRQIEVAEDRVKWRERMFRWCSRFGKIGNSDEVKEPGK